jgi:hypothetical protein
MRILIGAAAWLCLLTAAPFAAAQTARKLPKLQPPAAQPAPSATPAGQITVSSPVLPTAGVNGVPGANVYLPPSYANSVNYSGYPGSMYYGARYYPYGNNPYGYNPYGYAAGGMSGAVPSGQFYAFLGGPAATNPFANNGILAASNWVNATGLPFNGQPWNAPPNYLNFSNNPPYPAFTAAPVVGQSNGFFPNPALPLGAPAPQNNFGILNVPGINGNR